MIKIEQLYKKFGHNSVLRGIDLDISEGSVLALLGPNGSGKTTLTKCILGMVFPDSGQVYFKGQSIEKQWEYRNQIDYLPQIANFPNNLSVQELIKMIKDLRNCEAVKEQELIEVFKLQNFLNKKLNKLSGGTKQKVNLLLTFMFDSPVLILDEPTTGLDPSALIVLKKLINDAKSANKTILITSHIMSFVEEITEEIIYILEGRIYFKGRISELKETTQQSDFEHAIASILTNY